MKDKLFNKKDTVKCIKENYPADGTIGEIYTIDSYETVNGDHYYTMVGDFYIAEYRLELISKFYNYKYPIGEIEFLNKPDYAPDFLLDHETMEVPSRYYVHGSTRIHRDRDIKIIGYYNKYYIIKFKTSNGGDEAYTTLPFTEDKLTIVKTLPFCEDDLTDLNYPAGSIDSYVSKSFIDLKVPVPNITYGEGIIIHGPKGKGFPCKIKEKKEIKEECTLNSFAVPKI